MGFDLTRLDPVGVEIHGLQLGADLDAARLAALRSLVLEEGFVLARGQRLSEPEQVALGRRFGALESLMPIAPGEERAAAIANVDSRGELMPDTHPAMVSLKVNERWHTDSSFREVPASFSIFRAVEVPAEGGDTFYASLRRAWDELDAGLREQALGRSAIHDYHETLRRIGSGIPHWAKDAGDPITPPMVRKHPETGATGLYVSEHAFRVEGLEAEAGLTLLEQLVAHTTAPERVYRHHWREGDLALWDNRSMLHRAQGFDRRYRRVMHHVRVAGTEPVIAASA